MVRTKWLKMSLAIMLVVVIITFLAVGMVSFNRRGGATASRGTEFTENNKNNIGNISVSPVVSNPPRNNRDSVATPQVSQSPHFRNELIRTDFVPAEPNHYWCDLGQTYLKHRNYQSAIDSFNKALEVEKEPLHRAEILYFLGASYQYNGKTAVSPALMRDNLAQAKTAFQNSIIMYESIIDKLPAREQEVIKTRLAELYKLIVKERIEK